MIISHRHRFIFVKTRKTAGTSVEIALSRACDEADVITPTTPQDEAIRAARGGLSPRNTAIPVRGALDPAWRAEWWQQRRRPHFYNHVPATRIRTALGRKRWSSYSTFTVERNPWSRAVSLYYWRTKDLPARPSFTDFLRSTDTELLSNFALYADVQGPIVRRVLSYESLDTELEQLRAEVGLPGTPELPRAKSGHRPDDDWRALYSPQDIAFVADMCRREIAAFGYEFTS
jgi:hypothetical protein